MIVREKAYAKLNLSLDVLGKREDGYHEMLMVMQSISLYDEIVAEITEGNGVISVSTNRSFLPNNEKNLGYSAAQVFLREMDIRSKNVSLNIKKRIPVCAGMGGGSSDAAAVLRALNKGLGTGLSTSQLEELAASVGSDVPFCVAGGTSLAVGRGTEFKELPAIPSCAFVIVKPSFSVKTPALFSKLDSVKLRKRPDTAGLIEALKAADAENVSRRCYNVFEDVLSPKKKDLVDQAKAGLIACGAAGACMTGTGSAVFGIFLEKKAAAAAKNELGGEYRECFFADPVAKMV